MFSIPLFFISCTSAPPDPTSQVSSDFSDKKPDVEIWYSGPLDGEIEPCG